MVQQLRALDALVEDFGSVPSTYMAVHNHLLVDLISSWFLGAPYASGAQT